MWSRLRFASECALYFYDKGRKNDERDFYLRRNGRSCKSSAGPGRVDAGAGCIRHILFVGSKRGMEGKLVEKAGYAFRAIEIDNFRRSFKVADIRHNLHTAALVVKTPRQARAVLEDLSRI